MYDEWARPYSVNYSCLKPKEMSKLGQHNWLILDNNKEGN